MECNHRHHAVVVVAGSVVGVVVVVVDTDVQGGRAGQLLLENDRQIAVYCAGVAVDLAASGVTSLLVTLPASFRVRSVGYASVSSWET